MRTTNSLAAPLALLLALGVCRSAQADEIDYKKLYAKAGPGVVLVYGEQDKVGSVGTGSIIREDGLVVTNAHVILDHKSKQPFAKLFIFLKPEVVTGQNENDLKRGYRAQWLAHSADLDLALLRIVDPPQGLSVISISNDTKVGVGEPTAAIGHPEQGARWSLTTGRIGGEWKNFEGVQGKDVYQMETSVNRGNSGGPLLDGNGYLIGINTSIARRAADGLAITGINFAIKSSVVRDWIGGLQEKIAAAPELTAEPAPPPTAVASAKPPKLQAPPSDAQLKERQKQQATEQAQASTAGPAPQADRRAATQWVQPPPEEQGRVTVSAELPPPPPPAPEGFTSKRKPGQVLSPMELVRAHAQDAFDDLDREEAAHRGR